MVSCHQKMSLQRRWCRYTGRLGIHFGTVVFCFASDDPTQAVRITSRTSWLVRNSIHVCEVDTFRKNICVRPVCLMPVCRIILFLHLAMSPFVVPFHLVSNGLYDPHVWYSWFTAGASLDCILQRSCLVALRNTDTDNFCILNCCHTSKETTKSI